MNQRVINPVDEWIHREPDGSFSFVDPIELRPLSEMPSYIAADYRLGFQWLAKHGKAVNASIEIDKFSFAARDDQDIFEQRVRRADMYGTTTRDVISQIEGTPAFCFGVDYGDPTHTTLFMHDLYAIRRDLKQYDPTKPLTPCYANEKAAITGIIAQSIENRMVAGRVGQALKITRGLPRRGIELFMSMRPATAIGMGVLQEAGVKSVQVINAYEDTEIAASRIVNFCIEKSSITAGELAVLKEMQNA